MGIDVYAREIYDKNEAKYRPIFDALTQARDAEKDERKRKQLQGKVEEAYENLSGDGYLREAYHGGPYVTRYLVAEGWDDKLRDQDKDGHVYIPAQVLRERLPAAVLLAIYRRHLVYGEGPKHEVILEKGQSEQAFLGDILTGMFGPGGAIDQARTGVDGADLVAQMTPEQLRGAEQLIITDNAPAEAQQFIDFVVACQLYEAETGKPVGIYVSA